jgi:hypothetical protein
MKQESNDIKKYIFLVAFGLTLFLLSRYGRFSVAQSQQTYNTTEWFVYHLQDEKDYDKDGMPDCNSTFMPINETFLEIEVRATQKGGYKWASALCNISGVKEVGKWEYNPATDTWTYTGFLNYGKLTDYGLPSDWCNETNNYGFVIFGSGSGDKKYRLNFTEGHKVIQIYTGKGSEIKEAMTSKYILKVYDYLNWAKNKIEEAYFNGNEFWAQDLDLNIEMTNNGVNVKVSIASQNENVSKILSYLIFMHNFTCFTYSNTVKKMYCPENKTNITAIARSFALEELSTGKKVVNFTYSLPYLLVDGNSGTLDYYSEGILIPSEEEIYQKLRKSGEGFSSLNQTGFFNVSFTLAGTSHCIEFPIPRYSNVTLNVTMLTTPVNWTLGNYSEIVEYNYTQGNSLLAKIRVYPCCNIQNMTLQEAKVCS